MHALMYGPVVGTVNVDQRRAEIEYLLVGRVSALQTAGRFSLIN